MNAAQQDPIKPERNLPPAQIAAAPELLNYLRRGRVLLLAGKPIDGDSLASAIALRRILLSLDIKADLGSGDQIPESLQFLPDVEHVNYHPDFLEYESIVVLDCGDLRLTGFFPQLLKILQTKQLATVINIDHHLQDPPYGHLALVDPSASATGLVVYRLAKQWGATIDAPAATSLLATLYHDTGSFQHSNVDAETLRMAADCVRLGADAPDIAKRMYRTKTLKVLKLWGRALARARYQKETGVVSSVITQRDLQELNVASEDVSGIVNLLAHVPDGKFALLLTDEGTGTIKGSLRSDEGKNVNVARIANLLGGGGHKLASGFRVEGTIKEDDGVYRVV